MKITLISTYNKIIPNFGAKTYFLDSFNSHPDYKNNPNELEQDIFIGTQIENARNNIIKLKKELENTTDLEEKKKIEEEILIWKEQFVTSTNELTTRNIRGALKIAHEFKYLSTSFTDIISSANLGLLKAAKKYSPTKYPNVPFLSYAKYWIKQQIYRDLSKDTQVKIPVKTKDIKRKIERARYILENKLNRSPNIEEIAQYLNMPVEQIKKNLLMASVATISLDSQINTNDDSANFANLIPDPNSTLEDEHRMNAEDLFSLKKAINECLTPREKYIIEQRYRLNEKNGENTLVVLENISQKLNLSRERIRQLETNAILKLKKHFKTPPKKITQQIIFNEPPKTLKDLANFETPVSDITKGKTSLKAEKTTQQIILNEAPKPLEDLTSFETLVSDITEGETSSNGKKIIQKLKKLSPDKFKQILSNVTTDKKYKILIFKYLNEEIPSTITIAQKFDIPDVMVRSMEKEGLDDLKKFLLQTEHIGYSALKEKILENIEENNLKPSFVKRIQKVSPNEINEILKSLLGQREYSFITTKYGLGQDLSSVYSIKSNTEVANIFDTKKENVKTQIKRGIIKLRKYFSKPTKQRTNLARFAQDVCECITDPQKKEEYYKLINNFNKEKLDDFLKYLLSDREIIVLSKRYNLDKFDKPQTLTLTSKTDIIPHVLGISTKSGIDAIETNAFAKLEKFFNTQVPTNLEHFAEKVVYYLNNPEEKQSVQQHILSLNQEELENLLNQVLLPEEIKILKTRFTLEKPQDISIEQLSRVQQFSDSDFSPIQSRDIEKRALRKIRTYLTVGLPSNTTFFAEKISKTTKTPQEEKIILDIVSNKKIEELHQDFYKILSPLEREILIEYYGLDKYYPIKKDSLDMKPISEKIKKTQAECQQIQLNAIRRLCTFYKIKQNTNFNYFKDYLLQKISDNDTKTKVSAFLSKKSQKELVDILQSILPKQQLMVIIERYKLNEEINQFMKPLSYSEIGKKHKLSGGTLCIHEKSGFDKLLKYILENEN